MIGVKNREESKSTRSGEMKTSKETPGNRSRSRDEWSQPWVASGAPKVFVAIRVQKNLALRCGERCFRNRFWLQTFPLWPGTVWMVSTLAADADFLDDGKRRGE
jgi:hypothetical protein